MVVPHLLIHIMFTDFYSAFETCILGLRNALRFFWDDMIGNPLVEQGITDIPIYRAKCVPMKIHGGGIVCVGRGQSWQRSFDIWSFSSMVSAATTSLLANFMIWSLNKTLISERFANDTCRNFFRILCWNLLMCFSGKFLDRDWNGRLYEVALVPSFVE